MLDKENCHGGRVYAALLLASLATALPAGAAEYETAAPVIDAAPPVSPEARDAHPGETHPDQSHPTEPAAVESESKVERATHAVEGAVEKTGEAVKTVVDKAKTGAKTAAEKTGRVIRKAGEKIESVGTSK